MSKKPFLILIGGGTCSGKSNLSKEVAELAGIEYSVISTDDFMKFDISNYKPMNESLEDQIKKEYNCTDPQFLDINGLKQKIQQELNEQDSNKIIFLEGLHALYFEEIRNMADLKIFSNTDADLRLILKIRRSPWYKKQIGEEPDDPRKFGGSLPWALERWWNGVKPGEEKWVLPTKKYADLVLEANANEDFPNNAKIISSIVNLYFENEAEFHQKLKEFRKKGGNEELKKEYSSQLQTKIEIPPK